MFSWINSAVIRCSILRACSRYINQGSLMANSIVLIGFMGAGKDTIGKMLALKTGLGFLSTDEFIEISESRSISDIFRIKGEDYFRRKETSVLKAIQRLPNLIIATGGGMVMLEKNRRIIKKMGTIIHLDAGMSVLLVRTRIDRQRPLTKNRKYLKKLFRRRRGLYDFCDYSIDTENRTPTEIAKILMKKINLKSCRGRSNIQRYIIKIDRKKYPVLIGNNILAPALRTVLESKKITIISNPLVSSLYRSKLVKALKKKHSDIHEFILPDGEKYKNVNSALKTYNYLLKNAFDRSDMIIALGGGVISDLAGFAASTYKRGIKYVIIPTTLMGQVDAAIGGKTGIDMMVKNSIGTFYQPDLVIIDIDFIKTLSRQHFIGGLAEVVKYGGIRDSALFLLLEEKIY